MNEKKKVDILATYTLLYVKAWMPTELGEQLMSFYGLFTVYFPGILIIYFMVIFIHCFS